MTRVETIGTPVGDYAPDFELPGIDNQVHHLSRYLDNFGVVGVVSIRHHCPYVNLYINRLKEIQKEFATAGFVLIAINGSDNTGLPGHNLEKMRDFAERHQLNFPYLWDSTQDVSRSFGTIATPMAFVIDSHGILRYRGQIDNHPQKPLAKSEDYLRDAIAALLQGKEILIPETEPVGTPIIWRI
ncbi:thioredoxin family protein [Nostoc sp. CMAA1605]|uniref:thioredoxin family protein n=1 Tax=Nostoc sp. CMAA1605 TaxID=2055159 RepID=UPI001F45157E|nr:thioredoxin family protein [Nostoc sp. CMAA1605]MCF4966406.1 thioredoxin family protein [Nostoc sp. CMAA1605]